MFLSFWRSGVWPFKSIGDGEIFLLHEELLDGIVGF